LKRGLNIERTRDLFRDEEPDFDLPLLKGSGSVPSDKSTQGGKGHIDTSDRRQQG